MLEKEIKKDCFSEFSSCECGTEERNLVWGQVVTAERGCVNVNKDDDEEEDEDAGVGLYQVCCFPERLAFWNNAGFCPF